MPIIDSRPQRVFKRFEDHIEEVVRSVLPMPPGIKLCLRRTEKAGTLEFVRGAVGTAVPVETKVGTLYLTINQDLKAVFVPLKEPVKGYRLRTTRYAYKLLPDATATTRALLRWEYDSATEDGSWCRHHMHAKAAIPVGDGINLDRMHMPTGWVLIEHVLRFLFIDLDVTPRTEDWPQILRASETKFYESFTSKRYKAAA